MKLPVAPAHQRHAHLERLFADLSARGYRLTEQRRQVVAMLADQGSASAQELFDYMRQADSSIGRATVFRTLELLTQVGVVERVHRPDGCHSFLLSSPGHHHHLVCSDCGTVCEFSECELDDLLVRLAERTAFRIDSHWLEVFGLCQACQANAVAPQTVDA